jgi:hypothetical protein
VLERIVFQTGEALPRRGMLFSTGQGQACALAEKLGCRSLKGAVAHESSRSRWRLTVESGLPRKPAARVVLEVQRIQRLFQFAPGVIRTLESARGEAGTLAPLVPAFQTPRMGTSCAVELLAIDQQRLFQFRCRLCGRTVSFDGRGFIQPEQELRRIRRQAVHLPRLASAAQGDHGRPQCAIDKRYLSAHKLGGKYAGMIRQLAGHPENLMTSRMGPPGTFYRRTRNERADAGKFRVILKQQAVGLQMLEHATEFVIDFSHRTSRT